MLDFNFEGSLEKQELEDIQKEIDNMSSSRFIDTPGMYSLVIDSWENMDVKKPVPGWAFVKVKLKDVNNRGINHIIPVPLTLNLRYPTASGKNEYWALNKLQEFAVALGFSIITENFPSMISEMFGNSESLVGLEGKFDVGFRHPNYTEVYDDGFVLISGNSPISDEDTKEVIKFPSKQDAENYCTTVLKKPFSRFVEILVCHKKTIKVEPDESMIGF